MDTTKIFAYNGTDITFQLENGGVMVNVTEMAKTFGSRPKDWLRTEQSDRLIKAIAEAHKCTSADLVKVIKGGDDEQGTWMHEDVALMFSQWLSPELYIWCNDRIKELLKHGATAIYPEDLLNPDFIINLATELKRERAEKALLSERVILQSRELKLSAPKVSYHDEVLQSETLIQTNVIAKELGMSAVGLNRMLHDQKVIYKSGDTWVLYRQYQNNGYTGTKTTTYTDNHGAQKTSVHTYWTEKGRLFIHSLMNPKLNGVTNKIIGEQINT